MVFSMISHMSTAARMRKEKEEKEKRERKEKRRAEAKKKREESECIFSIESFKNVNNCLSINDRLESA